MLERIKTKPGYTLLLIAACFLLVGHIESQEPEEYRSIDCRECHWPVLDTYAKYAKAWPSPAELRGEKINGR